MSANSVSEIDLAFIVRERRPYLRQREILPMSSTWTRYASGLQKDRDRKVDMDTRWGQYEHHLDVACGDRRRICVRMVELNVCLCFLYSLVFCKPLVPGTVTIKTGT